MAWPRDAAAHEIRILRTRAALQEVLDAWKDGKSQAAFVKASPIHVTDARWAGHYKLVGYEIAGEEPHGHNLSYQVTLQLEDKQGKKLKEKATYVVATSPKKVVIRNQEL